MIESGHSIHSIQTSKFCFDSDASINLMFQAHLLLLLLFSTPWEIHGQPDERVSENMAEFALRSLVTMVEGNPHISVSGRVPQLGSHLEINKPFCYSILGSIIVVHLITVMVIALVTKTVFRTEDTFEAIANLLKEKARK